MKSVRAPFLWPVLGALLCLGLGFSAPVRAQDSSTDSSAPAASYEFSEDTTSSPPADINVAASTENRSGTPGEGPVRLARFSYIRGSVTWRDRDGSVWSPASVNLPVRQGAQIWVTQGRAEVQFDDGSLLRLGNGALVTLQTLYSDADGEFTEVRLNNGLASLRLKHRQSIYQVDTPLLSVKATGPARLRLGVGDRVEVAVRSGRATVEGSQGKTVLDEGSYLDLRDAHSPYEVRGLPAGDGWDRWNDDRDRLLDDPAGSRYLPSNIALVAGDLNDYGAWREDPRYGEVWCPHVVAANWRPYSDGRWTWVSPFGWTWVSDEPWGWAPYHYGSWVEEPYGWAWVPGPVNQYWCPAVVHFCEYGGNVGWVPLAPAEVRYPSFLSVGFRSGNWSLFFSIGGAAVYYPGGADYCLARPWTNVEVNRVTYNITNIYNTTIINNGPGHYPIRYPRLVNSNVYLRQPRFVPINARRAAGVTTAALSSFGGPGRYRPLPRGTTALFTQGRAIGAPPAGYRPFAGPIAVRPTAMALTPTRTFLPGVQPSHTVMARPIFRSPLPPQIERARAPFSRPAAVSAGHPAPARHPIQANYPAPYRLPTRTVQVRGARVDTPTGARPSGAVLAALRARQDLGWSVRPYRSGSSSSVLPAGRTGGIGRIQMPGRPRSTGVSSRGPVQPSPSRFPRYEDIYPRTAPSPSWNRPASRSWENSSPPSWGRRSAPAWDRPATHSWTSSPGRSSGPETYGQEAPGYGEYRSGGTTGPSSRGGYRPSPTGGERQQGVLQGSREPSGPSRQRRSSFTPSGR